MPRSVLETLWSLVPSFPLAFCPSLTQPISGRKIKKNKKNSPPWISKSSSGDAPEGATALLHFSKCSRPFIQSVKSTRSHLRNCNPRRGHPVKHRLMRSCTRRHAKDPNCVQGVLPGLSLLWDYIIFLWSHAMCRTGISDFLISVFRWLGHAIKKPGARFVEPLPFNCFCCFADVVWCFSVVFWGYFYHLIIWLLGGGNRALVMGF